MTDFEMLIYLVGITMLFFSSITSLYYSYNRKGNRVSDGLTILGAIILLFSSFNFYFGDIEGFSLRLNSLLPMPFELSFHIEKVKALFIAYISIAIIAFTILQTLLIKRLVNYKYNFFINLLYICIYLLILVNNVFFYLFILESVLLICFFVLSFDFNELKNAKRAFKYFFALQIGFILNVMAFIFYHNESGFSEISFYTAHIVEPVKSSISFILYTLSIILLTLILTTLSVSKKFNNIDNIKFNFIVLTLLNTVLVFNFLNINSVLALNVKSSVVLILNIIGLIYCVVLTYRQLKLKYLNLGVLAIFLQALIFTALGNNILLNKQVYEGIYYISLKNIILLAVMNSLLIFLLNLRSKLNKLLNINNETFNKICIASFGVCLIILLFVLFKPIFQAHGYTNFIYFVSIVISILNFLMTSVIFYIWINAMRRSSPHIEFEQIKEN